MRAGVQTIYASTVVLAAGTPMTPTMPLRSGIGPAEDLRRLGIAVVADRPGVGAGLYDQPGAVVPGRPAAGVVALGPGPWVVGRLCDTAGTDLGDAMYLALFREPTPGWG